MSAYYNEIDPYAAQWLRNLIAAGHIAPGEVDERSIHDVRPDDLRGFTQCHFFAGIGVWSHALRRAGWSDDRPVWTGSCPCQPFSSAGMARGFADERHLWPFFHFLIEECGPAVVFGEQVASKDGLGWLDLVHADMEGTGYAFGAVDLCAAGVGAPHIRQRLWFVADADGERLGAAGRGGAEYEDAEQRRGVGGLGDDDDARLEGLGRGHQAEGGRLGAVRSVAETGESGGVADTEKHGQQGQHLRSDGEQAQRATQDGALSGVDNSAGARLDGAFEGPEGEARLETRLRLLGEGHGQDRHDAAGPTNGHWRDADWLLCRDGRWRPVEPGTFPLAHGAPARVGRLRAYGNAIVAQAAEQVIRSYMEVRP